MEQALVGWWNGQDAEVTNPLTNTKYESQDSPFFLAQCFPFRHAPHALTPLFAPPLPTRDHNVFGGSCVGRQEIRPLRRRRGRVVALPYLREQRKFHASCTMFAHYEMRTWNNRSPSTRPDRDWTRFLLGIMFFPDKWNGCPGRALAGRSRCQVRTSEQPSPGRLHGTRPTLAIFGGWRSVQNQVQETLPLSGPHDCFTKGFLRCTARVPAASRSPMEWRWPPSPAPSSPIRGMDRPVEPD